MVDRRQVLRLDDDPALRGGCAVDGAQAAAADIPRTVGYFPAALSTQRASGAAAFREDHQGVALAGGLGRRAGVCDGRPGFLVDISEGHGVVCPGEAID